MEKKSEYYNGLAAPMLYGSEEFRQRIGNVGTDYYGTLLISCDFSGKRRWKYRVLILLTDAYTMSSISEIMDKLDLLTTVIQWDPVKKGLLLRLARYTLENAYFRIFGKVFRQTKYGSFIL